jgi:N-acetylmuramoyl-L-alanine amidase
MQRIRILSVSILLCFIMVCAAPAAAPDYAEIRNNYLALLGSAQEQRQRQNWLRVVKELEFFVGNTRDDNLKDDAEFLLGRTWHGLARASGSSIDGRQALKAYERLVQDYPNSNLADDALIAAAEIALESLSDQSAAYDYYLRITTELPPGDMLGLAQTQLKRLAFITPARPARVVEKKQVPRTATGTLSAIRVWNSPDYTRVVLDLSQASSYEPHQLKGSDPRIYLDLEGFRLSPEVSTSLAVNNSIVRQVRCSIMAEDSVRVVLDLLQDGEFQVFSLENPDRVVIDVRAVKGGAPGQVESRVAPSVGTDSIRKILDGVPASSPPALHVPQQNSSDGINLIVVDAGHGGRDPGAIGFNNTSEKDITLAMAKKLAAALRKSLKCKVLLTRSDDSYIPLQDRTAYANRVGADLFISLHANASTNRRAYGLETYYLNLSKNNQAAEVAARENGTTLEEVGNLEAILFDLMANAKINESSRLAAVIQQSLVQHLSPKFSSIKDLGVRQGPFHVLLGATMPSVLVETAFISNGREEKRLKTNDYQEQVATAIVKGVKDYAESVQQVAHR